MDDVRDEGARILLPESMKWRALITTRSKTLAESLTPKVRPLESLLPSESMALFRNVLAKDFVPDWKKDYQELADFLAHRPYGIRLAAESMKQDLTHTSPPALLDTLASHEVSIHVSAGGGAKTLESLWPFLDHCLTQLETRSPFARELLDSLAVCSDEGMELSFFLEWQKEFASPDQVEHELTMARDLGLLLVEAPVSTQPAEEKSEPRIRLHTDLLNRLRRAPFKEQNKSLHRHLRQILVENPGNMESKRPLQKQIMALYTFYRDIAEELIPFYFDFWEHLYRTGRLNWAYDIGESSRLAAEKRKKQGQMHTILGNQALILVAWGKLKEAMDLHKKNEENKKQLGDQAGLSNSYGNQALILRDWGKLDKTMGLQRKIEETFRQLGHQAGLALSYGNQGMIYHAWGKFEEAMDLHKKQEEICQQLGDLAGLASSYCNQAIILKVWGKLEKAMVLHRKEEGICLQLDDQAGLARSYGNQALILQARGKFEEAMDLNKKAEEIFQQLGHQAGLATVYGNQALVLHARGKLKEAMDLHKKEEEIKKQLGDQAGLVNCYWNMGTLYREMGWHEMALEKLKAAIKIDENLKMPRLEQFREYLADYMEELEGTEEGR